MPRRATDMAAASSTAELSASANAPYRATRRVTLRVRDLAAACTIRALRPSRTALFPEIPRPVELLPAARAAPSLTTPLPFSLLRGPPLAEMPRPTHPSPVREEAARFTT